MDVSFNKPRSAEGPVQLQRLYATPPSTHRREGACLERVSPFAHPRATVQSNRQPIKRNPVFGSGVPATLNLE